MEFFAATCPAPQVIGGTGHHIAATDVESTGVAIFWCISCGETHRLSDLIGSRDDSVDVAGDDAAAAQVSFDGAAGQDSTTGPASSTEPSRSATTIILTPVTVDATAAALRTLIDVLRPIVEFVGDRR